MGLALPMLAMETKMKTRWPMHGEAGFTLTELAVVVCAIAIAVAVWLSLPFARASKAAKRKAMIINCVNNLKQIDVASRIWEGIHGDADSVQLALTNAAIMNLVSNGNAYILWQIMSNELNPKVLVCPADDKRSVATSFGQGFSDANISYFLNLDASSTYPQMLLFGDDNMAINGFRVRPGILNLWTNTSIGWTKERHGGLGNIALSDGSVQTTTSAALQQAVQSAGTTNRLAIP